MREVVSIATKVNVYKFNKLFVIVVEILEKFKKILLFYTVDLIAAVKVVWYMCNNY